MSELVEYLVQYAMAQQQRQGKGVKQKVGVEEKKSK